MLRTKNLVTSIMDVPNAWIFEHYLSLTECLNGQDLAIRSVFNTKDTKPSFFIFYSSAYQAYFWKDFSSGKSGDGVELVKEIRGLNYHYEAKNLIVNDFNTFSLNNDVSVERTTTPRKKYKLLDYQVRPWNIKDQEYWTQFKISSDMLTFFNVKPLRYYQFEYNGQASSKLKRIHMYGFFTAEGELYKIYQPGSEYKFIKIKDYLQGSDQLTRSVPYLVICSSLKDGMAFKMLGFKNAEIIAPSSETSTISLDTITELKSSYKSICTIFDNDTAGRLSMDLYHEKFDIPGVTFKYEKDLADCMQTHGIVTTRELLQPMMSKVLKEIKPTKNEVFIHRQ